MPKSRHRRASTLSAKLARWSIGLELEDLPATVVEDVKRRVLDTLGLILSGARTPIGRAGAKAVRNLGARGRARLIPFGDGVSPANAGLAHGTQAHAEDFDDTHNESIMHSSASVVATALSLGDQGSATGADLVTAVAVGNELNCRLGCVVPGGFHEFGFHPTSVLGAIGSAVVASRMLGLDEAGTVNAMGIAGSQSSGILEAYQDGTWSKTLHPGWAAHSGIIAAELARAGFTGPATVLEGRFGVFHSFLHGQEHRFDLDRVARRLGRDWEQLASSFKPYPCAHAIHSFVDAALAIRREHRLAPRDVRAVQATVAEHFVAMILEPMTVKLRPRTPTHARASLPYALAAALHFGRLEPAQYSERAIATPGVLALARRFSYELDPGAPPPTQYKGVVTITTVDGTRHRAVVEHNRGSAENPLELEALARKFRHGARALPATRRRQVEMAIRALERSGNVRRLIGLCIT